MQGDPHGPASSGLESVWRALASPVRREILDRLREAPATTGALAACFPALSRFAVMQHLRVLEQAELVVPHREGRQRYNYLNPVPIQRIHDRWVARYLQPWTEALVSLKGELETEPRAARAGSPRTRRPR
jgi:DNA-binding transcriptional ArsR family regulator